MTKLSVVVKTNEETKTIKVEGLSEQGVVQLVRDILGTSVTIPISDAKITIPKINTEPVITPLAQTIISTGKGNNEGGTTISASYKNESVITQTANEIPLKQSDDSSRARQLPLIGSENRTTFALGESSKWALPQTKLSESGVRLFRTYVKCPHCETAHPGRYVNHNQEYLKCFECKEKVAVQPASKETQIFEGDEIPKLSIDGYYFYAKEKYEEPLLV